MINIIIDDPILKKVNKNKIKNSIIKTLIYGGINPNEIIITVVISDDKLIQDLNKKYLNIDRVTDVLAFPANEIDPETGNQYLGDIVISFPQLSRQAKDNFRDLNDELILLCVHGTLHLMGFDHADEKSKQKMWSAQQEIIQDLKNLFKSNKKS